MIRLDQRNNDELRGIKITKPFLNNNPHSVLIEFGNTKVLCSAFLFEDVPRFKKNSGEGWLNAEYSMLPCSSSDRIERERYKVGGRTMEIQRLIGRVLRSVIDFKKLGERTIKIDADVIQADGGTRTTSINGCFIALKSLINQMLTDNILNNDPLLDYVAAISVGICNQEVILDLAYSEDSVAEVDMNIAMTGSGKFIEIQGTAETNPFTQEQLANMLSIAKKGILEIINKQKAI